MCDLKRVCRDKRGQAGVSLLEVLIAVSLLGICFTALFSSFSTALRTTDRVDRYSRSVEYATNKLNELLVDPKLEPGQAKSGISDSGLRWRANTELVDKRPASGPDRPAQLMRITLEVSWTTPVGVQSFALQTLKLRIPEAAPTPTP